MSKDDHVMDDDNYLLVNLPNQKTLVEFTEDSKVNPNNWPLVRLKNFCDIQQDQIIPSY